ncbi:MAG: DUF2149 domain-containing protein [Solirubrobacterales bacterium]
MKVTPTPGSVAGRRTDKAGDPLDGLINLFDLSLVLAVGLLLAALSSIGATNLITPQGGVNGTPLQGQPPSSPADGKGQGQEVGKVYRLDNGQYIFAPSAAGATGGSGATNGATGATSTAPGATSVPGTSGSTGSTGIDSTPPGGQTIDPSKLPGV